ncbi:MAG TPA: zinc ribbon domain-containing protein [Nitrososphaerales archaeon]|nr:zinc ribbon domain-containing protein [Nitrososphaerales archaeon]
MNCASCGTSIPEGALFCPACGAKVGGLTFPQPTVSPSHFNSGITATAPPQTTVPTEGDGSAQPPPPSQEERRHAPTGRRRGLVFTVIVALAVLLVGVTFEAGMLSSGGPTAPAVNTASTPLSGQQLYDAYSTNRSQATSSYTNKTIFIQDSVDFGVGVDSSGQYFSTLDSGSVVLEWDAHAQVSQLFPGATVLAKCSVQGPEAAGVGLGSPSGYVVYLQDCALIKVQSQSGGSTQSISVAND